MSSVTLHGNPVHVGGNLPAVGSHAPAFTLVATDLSEKALVDFAGKRKVLNIFPSVDTGVCATSVRHFNKDAAALTNTVVLCISADLPFAQARFCGAEGIDNVVMLSTLRGRSFLREGLRENEGFGYCRSGERDRSILNGLKLRRCIDRLRVVNGRGGDDCIVRRRTAHQNDGKRDQQKAKGEKQCP